MARIGMVRNDLDNAQVLLNDLENKSQESYELRQGQERYFERPTETAVDAWRLDNAITAVTAAAIIAGTNPVGGPIDVSIATINALDASINALTAAQKEDLQEILAPFFFETDVFQQSFRNGTLSYLSGATFAYAGVTAAALEVVEDDGVTPYHVP